MGRTALVCRPFILGLVFLIPLDTSFSCWFFFFFWKAQLILVSALGWRARPEFPEQTTGSYVALFFIALWLLGRRHLMSVFRSISSFGKGQNISGDSTEPLPYKTAVIGGICGLTFIMFFCWRAGMSIWMPSAFFAIYLMTEIGITRVRAEVGSPIHDLHFAGPEYLVVDAVGTRKLGASNLSIVSFFWFLTQAHYSDVMPHQLEGFKLADRTKINKHWVFVIMLVASIFGTVIAFWVILDSSYRYGNVWGGGEPFKRLQGWLSHPTSTDVAGLGFFAYGLLFGVFLMIMRLRFLWWPFHPTAYAVSSTYGMRGLWSMFFLAWLVKWVILKYGDLKGYRQALPHFSWVDSR